MICLTLSSPLLILQIIHLKRFQFVNGHWIKCQRAVKFPLEGLDPLRYTVQNGNGRASTPQSPHSAQNGNGRGSTPQSPYSSQNGNERSSTPQSPDSIITPVRQCSTEPMEVVSRGDSSSDQNTSPGGGAVGERGDKVGVCRLEGGMGEMEVADGMKERKGSDDGSARVMGEPMEDEGCDACSTSSPNAESINSTPTLDLPDFPKLYNLFAISVSSSHGHCTL